MPLRREERREEIQVQTLRGTRGFEAEERGERRGERREEEERGQRRTVRKVQKAARTRFFVAIDRARARSREERGRGDSELRR